MSTTTRTMTLVAAIGATALLAAPLAAAHVTADPGRLAAGEYGMVSFRVPHGCEGSPTTKLSVKLPEGVASATPEAVPGWKPELTSGKLDEPVELHGETVTEGPKEVTWTGGPLADGEFVDFGLSIRMPDRPGETVYFPAVQTCESGETAWVQIPTAGQSEHDLDEPAPAVTLTAPAAGHGEDAAEDAGGDTREVVDVEPAATVQDGGDDGALSIVAIVVGGLGLLAGAAAIVLARRRGSGHAS